MRKHLATLILVMATAACSGIDPEPICQGPAVRCDAPAYFALCSEPGTNDAVREARGSYCVGNDGDDFTNTYIGPDLDFAPDCSGGQVQACPNGEEPTCYFLANCDDDSFGTTN